MLSNKQINRIKKEYPKKSVNQIAEELHISPSQIYRVLSLKDELVIFWIDTVIGFLTIALLLIAPLVFIRGLHDFADLPQRVFIQTIAVCLLLLWFLRTCIKKTVTIPRNPLFLILPGFIVWSLLTLFWARDTYEGFYAAIHIAACGAVSLMVSTILSDTKWVTRMLWTMLVSATIVVIIGLAQQLLQFQWIPMAISPAATFGNPNMAADYVAIVLPLIIIMGLSQQRIVIRYVVIAIVLLSIVFLFYTHCRGAALAVVCSSMYMAFLYVRRKYSLPINFKWTGVTVFLIGCLISICVFSGLNTSLKKAALSEYRLIAWKNCLEMVKAKPLQGFGAGNFKIFYPAYSHKAVIDPAFDTTKHIGKAHNDYIQIAAELGMPGLLLFLMIPLYGLVLSWRLMQLSTFTSSQSAVIGLAGGLLAFMVVAFFSFPMQRAVPPLLIFTYLGILATLYNQGVSKNNIWRIKFPQAVGLIIMFCLFIAGFIFIRFDWENIIGDRYYVIAMGMEKSGMHSSALSAGLHAHNYNKYRMDILTTVGRAYAATGEPDKAITILKKVTEGQPYNLNALFLLGAAYANADNNEKALETFRRVLQIQPDFQEAKKIVCLLKAHGKVRVGLS
ncbi:MAG: O-antigen ligase family protein [Proteobacteria bacterium]|nr:O-antigen ligase family protein [Pseudomonadota bacterium]